MGSAVPDSGQAAPVVTAGVLAASFDGAVLAACFFGSCRRAEEYIDYT